MRERGLAVVRTAAQRYGSRALSSADRSSKAWIETDCRSLSTQVGRNVTLGEQTKREETKALWNSNRVTTWMAAGAFSLSFAASTMSAAFAKERVVEKFSPREVVLYQYDACPFCNKVKGRLSSGVVRACYNARVRILNFRVL